MGEADLVESLEKAVSWTTDEPLARSRLRELVSPAEPTTSRKTAKAIRDALRAGISRIDTGVDLPGHGRVSALQVRDALIRLLGLGAGMQGARAPDRRREAGRILGVHISDKTWSRRGYDAVLVAALASALPAGQDQERRQRMLLERVEMTLFLDDSGNPQRREAGFAYKALESSEHRRPAILQEMEYSAGQAIRDATGCALESETRQGGVVNAFLLPLRESGQAGYLSYVADVVVPRDVYRGGTAFSGQRDGRIFGYECSMDKSTPPHKGGIAIAAYFPIPLVILKLRAPAAVSVRAIAGSNPPDPLESMQWEEFPVTRTPDGLYQGTWRDLMRYHFYGLMWQVPSD